MEKRDREELELRAASLIADQQTAKITEASMSLLQDSKRLRELAEKWRNVAPDIAQGHLFEQLHVVKFNLMPYKKGVLM